MVHTKLSSTNPYANWSIKALPGLTQQQQVQLQALGINSTLDLLQSANSTNLKQQLANQLRIKVQYLNKWVAMANLARIPSVGCQYCGLLLHAGIASVAQLSQTPIHRLHRQILRLQVATIQRRDLCPCVDEVQKWVEEAKLIRAAELSAGN